MIGSMGEWINEKMIEWMNGQMNGWMNGQMSGQTAWIDKWVDK